MKKIAMLAGIVFGVFFLTACSSNKLAGKWVNYSPSSEKTYQVWEFDKKGEKLIVESYYDGKKSDSKVLPIKMDKDTDAFQITSGDESGTRIDYSVKDDTLIAGQDTLYKEGSQADKKAAEKAKKERQKTEKKEKAEKDKEAKAKSAVKNYNAALSSLAKRLNESVQEKIKGTWYKGKALETTESYYSGDADKLVVDGDKITLQETAVSFSSDERKVKKEDPNHYTFKGVTFTKVDNVENEDADTIDVDNYILPKEIAEVEKIKTLEDFANYQKEHNVRDLQFEYQSNGGNANDGEIIFNANDPSKFYLSGSGSYFSSSSDDDTFKAEIPGGYQAADWDI